jgi:protein-ribulosamine 3-kinase
VSIWNKIEQKISASTGQFFQLENRAGIAGGSINQAHRIDGVLANDGENKTTSYFIKLNDENRLDMFEAEAAGLAEIQKSHTIYAPHVVCLGIAENQSYLVLEYLTLSNGAKDSAKQFGQQLAAMHKITANQFGWSRDNTIGSTEQINTQTNNWIDFWREHRLGFQLELARQNGCGQSLYIKGEKLLAELGQFFIGYESEPSLLHGDLWSGNYGYLKKGQPVIFDPAVYYGDRETDIAMSELFGGFPPEFYVAYNETWPLDKGYQQRKSLYNLYHILNHFNLFGAGYASQAENMLDKLLLMGRI